MPGLWTAVFGFYTTSLRPATIIPGQVRTLRSLLARVGESKVESVIVADDQNGSWVPKAKP